LLERENRQLKKDAVTDAATTKSMAISITQSTEAMRLLEGACSADEKKRFVLILPGSSSY
jgi:hypothetical protein